jgi:tRNA dimethylallyltransferase
MTQSSTNLENPHPAPRPIAVLTGPTGSGKSGVAMRLAREFPIEIVSVDSAQVYRGLDIGSAKPEPAERAAVPHHLIDLVDPAEHYSAGQFVRDASRAIADIEARGRAPLLVGGTMLYLRSLVSGISTLPTGSESVRARIDADAARLGWPALHARLAGLDPVAAARIHPNDAQRIQRALEVQAIAGEPLSSLQRRSEGHSRLEREFVIAALVPGDRARLHTDLAQRFQRMMDAGLLEEVRRLHARGDLTAEHPALRAVGYRQLWSHLDGVCPLAAAVERGVAATRQLAKRQLTWLRSMPGTHVFDPYDAQAFVGIRECLKSAFCHL